MQGIVLFSHVANSLQNQSAKVQGMLASLKQFVVLADLGDHGAGSTVEDSMPVSRPPSSQVDKISSIRLTAA